MDLSRLPASVPHLVDDFDSLAAANCSRLDMTSQCKADVSLTSIGEGNGKESLHVYATERLAMNRSYKNVQFWGVVVALCIASLLGGLEATVVTTSLPTIVNELNIGNNYVWITNILFLTR
jgi:hypothetical protein